MALITASDRLREAEATVTVAVHATSLQVIFSRMSTTLDYDSAYLLDYLLDATTFDTLDLMGYSPPIVQSLRSQTTLLSQRLDQDSGRLAVQISRILYVTVPATDGDSGAYNERLVPDKSTVDVAMLSVFTHPDQRIGLVTKLRTAMPDIFSKLENVSFDYFVARGAEVEHNPVIIARDADHTIAGHHFADALPSFMPTSMPTAAPSPLPSTMTPTSHPETKAPTFAPSTIAPTHRHPTAKSIEKEAVTNDETLSLEIWERPEGDVGVVDVDSEGKYGQRPETSGEVWELPGSNHNKDGGVIGTIEGGTDASEVPPDECNTQAFLQKGGMSLEVVYNYDLLYTNGGADVQNDIIVLDQMIPKHLRSSFGLTCEEDDLFAAFGGISSQKGLVDSKHTDTGGLYWINRGYLDARRRSGVCTSREGMTASEYDLGCIPMVAVINIFLVSSADAEKVKAKVLQSIQMANFETEVSKSWAVYVGQHDVNDLSSTDIVAGATGSSWTEQTVGQLTIKSILIYGAVAVLVALVIIAMALLLNNIKRKRRNTKESQQFEQLQHKRRAKKEAKRNAIANKQFAEKYNTEKSNDVLPAPEEMGYEAEPVVSAVVVYSTETGQITTGEQGSTAPAVFDRQETIALSPTAATNTSSFSFDV